MQQAKLALELALGWTMVGWAMQRQTHPACRLIVPGGAKAAIAVHESLPRGDEQPLVSPTERDDGSKAVGDELESYGRTWGDGQSAARIPGTG